MKNRKNIKYIVFFVLALAGLVIMKILTPEEIDWRMTFSHKDHIPFGTKILYECLEDIFPDEKLIINEESFYESLGQFPADDQNLIVITDNFAPDDLDTESLLAFIKSGNNAFIAANEFSDDFLDTLGLKREDHWEALYHQHRLWLTCYHPELGADSIYHYDKFIGYTGFKEPLKDWEIRGRGFDNHVCNIERRFGKGCIFLSTQAAAFTNYYMVYEKNSDYAFGMLSYLPYGKAIWDNYYKPFSEPETAQSPMRYILSRPAFRNAWYIGLITILLFLVFGSRRRQKVILLIEPPKNTSLEFVETIGRLYLHTGDHKDLAEKKFMFFLDFIRTRYYLRTDKQDNQFFNALADKSGIDENKIRAIFKMDFYISKEARINEHMVQTFNRMIEEFYQNCT